MADLRESFPTLENVLTSEGVALGARAEGDAAAGIQGSIGFAFKDSSGNVVLPQLNSQGQIQVTSELAGNGKRARGTVAGSGTQVTVATLALVAGKKYENLDFVVSCFRDAVFSIIWNDNGVESILADALVGPGQFSFHAKLEELEFTAGTGTQQILVKALNLGALSDFRAALSIKELV